MTHEFKRLIQAYQNAKKIGLKSVIATVVAVDGSSYRRPGVRMLITENGHMFGAVSGGCVEKEIQRQSLVVFKSGRSKLMTYDGRYRLGCEGVLYILIETFDPVEAAIKSFEKCLNNNSTFRITSVYSKENGNDIGRTCMIFDELSKFYFSEIKVLEMVEQSDSSIFTQIMEPSLHLVIIGAEHDAVQLCSFASALGWNVTIVSHISDKKGLNDFPGAQKIIYDSADNFNAEIISKQTIVVLMTHSYVKDLKYLIALKDIHLVYVGILGPANRKERLLDELTERFPLIDDSLFDRIYGPTGLDIGAETPEEISISICSEILAVVRNKDAKHLKDKSEKIHHNISL